MVVTDDYGGCNMVVTDKSGGCNMVVTDNSGGCNMVVTDNSCGCNMVVTYDNFLIVTWVRVVTFVVHVVTMSSVSVAQVARVF